MGVTCCTEGNKYKDIDKEVLISRDSIKGRKGRKSNMESMDDLDSFNPNNKYKVETQVDYTTEDFAHYGQAPPEKIQERTRVVKMGKKIRK